jgi:hypothetical protein
MSLPIDENGRNQQTGPSITEITLTIEFLTMALRAVAEGHSIKGKMVREPLVWGFSKYKSMVAGYLDKGSST